MEVFNNQCKSSHWSINVGKMFLKEVFFKKIDEGFSIDEVQSYKRHRKARNHKAYRDEVELSLKHGQHMVDVVRPFAHVGSIWWD